MCLCLRVYRLLFLGFKFVGLELAFFRYWFFLRGGSNDFEFSRWVLVFFVFDIRFLGFG